MIEIIVAAAVGGILFYFLQHAHVKPIDWLTGKIKALMAVEHDLLHRRISGILEATDADFEALTERVKRVEASTALASRELFFQTLNSLHERLEAVERTLQTAKTHAIDSAAQRQPAPDGAGAG